MALEKISRLKNSNKTFSSKAGFTLLEVMIVVGILAALAVLAIPQIDNTNNKLKAAVRQMRTLSRQVRNLAKMQSATYRLVIDLKEGADSEEEQSYWVEKSTKTGLLSSDREEQFKLANSDEEDEQKKANADFEVDKTVIKNPKTLPNGMFFDSIELGQVARPLTTGKVYIHFLPTGLVEESALYFTINDKTWTLAIHPLTGRADVINERLSLKQISEQ